MPDTPVPAAPAQAAPPPAPAWGTVLNLRSGLALAVLLRRPPSAFVKSFDQLLALVFVNAAVWVALEWLQHANADSVLGLDAFYALSCYVLIGLGGCAVVARVHSREANTRALLVPLLAAAPLIQAVFRGVAMLLPADREGQVLTPAVLALGVAIAYLALLSLRALQAAFGQVGRWPGLAAVLVVAGLSAALTSMDLDTRLWVTDTADATPDDENVEPVLYGQPEALAAAVARVDTQRRAGGAVYFVGFAGDGDQGVFRREALLADRAISDHFGVKNRSLDLINIDNDRDTYPLATVTGLSEGLKLLGGRIDRANDIVVVTLTSHGSTDGVEVTNGGLPLLQLEPDDLRQALDDAGIKWRVVIVSACYAGVFVDALKSDTTLVITAADESHSSFGCEDQRDLTWFGEAFFKDALPGSDSLEHAFNRAAALIAEREQAQHLPHSNPQMVMGSLMRAKLATLESRPHQAAGRTLTIDAARRR